MNLMKKAGLEPTIDTEGNIIGKIVVQPGAYNVIPGKVIMGLEIRYLSAEKLKCCLSKLKIAQQPLHPPP